MAIAVQTLLTMSQAQLDELFTKATSGDIPNGEARGTAIVAPGTTFTSEIATFINLFAWQGKMLDAKASLLVNESSTVGLLMQGKTFADHCVYRKPLSGCS